MAPNPTAKAESTLSPATFEQLKKETAEDIRAVAGYLMERAAAVEAGDMAVMEHLIDEELIRWREMLLIRFAVKNAEVEEAR